MKIRVLGCHGGVSPDHRATCFLWGERLAIDAGALCTGLTLDEQLNVDDIVLTSSRLDHVAELGAFADNVFGRRKAPVTVHCTQATADALKKSLFNNSVWPDFTSVPSASQPTLKFKAHAPGKKFNIGELEITLVQNKHPVDSVGVMLGGPQGHVCFSGDTGPTQAIWDHLNKLKDLRALFVECTYPTSMQRLADVAGHLTPTTLAVELKKLAPPPACPVFAYHLKPPTLSETRKELRALRMRELHLARHGDIYEV
ncbi:MAG: 3',5'-cyclic-nucleotide phosphodiesterase [Deltaproteobacteria bacterium]|nr:3',5'-cyclic-nucleotide phosphodiesterase [Deltaproteobacteria bacterium]